MSEFFFDRNLPEKLARMLDCFDRQDAVVYHDDWCDRMMPDEDWLRLVASRGAPPPRVVSADVRILTSRSTAQVLQGLPLTFFAFMPGWFSLPWSELAWKAVKAWPSIVANANPREPTIFKVTVNGKVDRYCLTRP
jgi:hypothetical protein